MSKESQTDVTTPILLKKITKKVQQAGQVAMGTAVVDKATGRPIAGIVGIAEVQIMGVRALVVAVVNFDEETVDGSILTPDMIGQ